MTQAASVTEQGNGGSIDPSIPLGYPVVYIFDATDGTEETAFVLSDF